MDVQLTEGAIKELMFNRHVDRPVLQLIGVRKIRPNFDRYRLTFSDGIHLSASFMLATQLNDRLTNGELKTFSVICIDKLVLHCIPPTGPTNKLVVIILEFTVVSNDPELGEIGNPTVIEQNMLNTGTPTKNESPAPSSFLTDPPAASSFASETSSFRDSSRNSNQFINRNPSFASKRSNRRRPTSQFAGKTFPISTLTPYQNRRAIRAPQVQFNSVPVQSLSNAGKDAIVDVLGICKSCGDMQTFSLRSWFDNETAHSDMQSLSSKSGAGFSGPAEWKCLSQVEEDDMGWGDKADYLTCKAMVLTIRKENCLYKACTVPGCNKKVVENNGFYRCEKCDRETTDFKWRLLLKMNLADYSGNLWVTCFQEQAETVLGKTAEELDSLSQSGDEEQVHAAIMGATFNSFVFKLGTKVEDYNDENRIKTNVITVSEVSHAEYGKKLIEDLQN